jgi:hypothetical protein
VLSSLEEETCPKLTTVGEGLRHRARYRRFAAAGHTVQLKDAFAIDIMTLAFGGVTY